MTDSDLPLNELFGIPEGPIPPVDPADLRRVWDMQRGFHARAPGAVTGDPTRPPSASGCGTLDNEFYKRASSPGANVGAVWFRTAMLGMLEMLGMLAPWIHEGVVADAVFKVAATFPMEGVTIGVPRQGLPFDVQEFVSQVAKS